MELDRGFRAEGEPGLAAAIGVDETTAWVAALVQAELGLAKDSPEAAAAARNKLLQRKRLSDRGLPVPRFEELVAGADAGRVAETVGFPCVLKPLVLSVEPGRHPRATTPARPAPPPTASSRCSSARASAGHKTRQPNSS